MNHVSHALKALTLVVVIATPLGCALPDLTVTELSVTSCSNSEISYSFTILNRDYTSNICVGPQALGMDVLAQAWVSSTQTLNENDAADQPAGGRLLFASRDYGPDELLSPGETVSDSLSVGWGVGSDFSLDLVRTPYLILKVDPKNLFDPQSTKDGVINERYEGNNERFVLIGTCN